MMLGDERGGFEMEKQFYTVQEVADIFGLSKRTVAKMVGTGEISSTLIGKSRRIPAEYVARKRAAALVGEQ